jgi:signal peptidase I
MSGSPRELPVPPLKDNNERTPPRYIYNGTSMNPLFHAGQVLYVHPTARELSVGDIIVFNDPINKVNVVHRIVAISDNHLITRGDNNSLDDPVPVQFSQVLGKVQTAEDNTAFKKVRGGRIGLWGSIIGRMLRGINHWGTHNLGFPYRALRRSRIMQHLWRPVIVKIHVQTNEGSFLIKYIYKHHTVAIWDPLQQQFTCSKPFDLVLFPPDEKAK